MREILFRGKRTDNGEWVQGYPCRYGWIGKEKDYIIPDYASALYTAEINPETVGQYMSIEDKNGKQICEGDIVWCEDDEEYGIVEWDKDTARFVVRFYTFIADFDNLYGDEIEIVGNAYDNPEMMKEIEEDDE